MTVNLLSKRPWFKDQVSWYLEEYFKLWLYNIICLTETWLNTIGNVDLFGTGFKYFVYRKDRDLTFYNKEDGGGVLLAIKTTLRSILLNISDTKSEDLTICCENCLFLPDSSIFPKRCYHRILRRCLWTSKHYHKW